MTYRKDSLKNHYYLLLVDIKKSTSLSQKARQKVFEKLTNTVKNLNQLLHEMKLLPFRNLTISYGDEIAALFENSIKIFYVITELREAIYPEALMRFVVVYDEIGVEADDIRAIGGEVFSRADNLMKQLKKKGDYGHWSLFSPNFSANLNSLTEMSNGIVEQMTPYQHMVWLELKKGLTQKQIAEKLDRFPQSVSNAIKKGQAEMVIRAEKVITEILVKH